MNTEPPASGAVRIGAVPPAPPAPLVFGSKLELGSFRSAKGDGGGEADPHAATSVHETRVAADSRIEGSITLSDPHAHHLDVTSFSIGHRVACSSCTLIDQLSLVAREFAETKKGATTM
jgi:hypothetical protein